MARGAFRLGDDTGRTGVTNNIHMTESTARSSLIVQVLISLGLALIVIVGFTALRVTGTAEEVRAEQQSTYETHDIKALEGYRAPYVGDNSNTAQALYTLPLGSRISRVEIHDTAVVAVLSDGTTTNERENALYSAVAFMAAVDNASSVTFQSGLGEYTISREAVEQRFGAPLSKLLDSEEEWQRVRTLVPVEVSSLVA